jgi:predicted dehydrogenase
MEDCGGGQISQTDDGLAAVHSRERDEKNVMTPRTVSILGYGKVARELHRPTWKRLEAENRARVVSIYETSPHGVRAARQEWPNTKVVEKDAIEALATDDAEVADICTPGHTHGALALQAVACGRHVLVEKPLCQTPHELDSLLDTPPHSKIAIYQTLRCSSPVLAVKEAIADGRMGRVTRMHVTHHARHVLNEAEWITTSRPDGVLFENAVHFVDLIHFILDALSPLQITAARFYETSHKPIVTGVEFMAEDVAGRHVTMDFLQDTLRHSAIYSQTHVSATGADAELRFYPSGFRLLSGVVDPLNDLSSDVRRTAGVVGGLFDGRDRRTKPHLMVAVDLLGAIDEDRPASISPSDVRGTMKTLFALSRLWKETQTPCEAAPTDHRDEQFAKR